MIQIIYQNHFMTFEEIYHNYPGPPNPDAFAVWFKKSLTRNTIQYVTHERICKELYAKQLESDRKQTIRGQLVITYLSSCGKIKKKQRKALKDAYKKSEQYQIDFENACQSDSILQSISNEKELNHLYEDYIERLKHKEYEAIKKQLCIFIDRKHTEILQELITEDAFYEYESDLCTSIISQFERRLHTLSNISDYSLNIPHYYGEYYIQQKKPEKEEIEYFIECCMFDSEEMLSKLLYGASYLDGYLTNYFFQVVPGLKELENKDEWKSSITRAISEKIPQITEAVLRFPESLLGIDASLSEILEQWNNMNPHTGYKIESVMQQLSLCRELEAFTDQKRLIYDFITIPFDSNNAKLKSIWEKLFIDELNHRPFNYQRFLPIVYDSMDEQYLNILEDHYKVCDLLGFYMSRFHPMEVYEDINRLKNEIFEQIVKILNNQKLTGKKCKNCGCDLSWNHPYGICKDCYSWKKCNHFGADSYL